jgi:hypothetical protein
MRNIVLKGNIVSFIMIKSGVLVLQYRGQGISGSEGMGLKGGSNKRSST